jgi:lincosamide nucleotidyltransferase A/C/D/E
MRHDNVCFPADIFSGKGNIGGIAVRCLTAEAQILYRHGYDLRDKDIKDVLLLCEAFGFQVPEEFKKTAIV